MDRTQFLALLLVGSLCVQDSFAGEKSSRFKSLLGLKSKEPLQPLEPLKPLPQYLDESCRPWASMIDDHLKEASEMISGVATRMEKPSPALQERFREIFNEDAPTVKSYAEHKSQMHLKEKKEEVGSKYLPF